MRPNQHWLFLLAFQVTVGPNATGKNFVPTAVFTIAGHVGVAAAGATVTAGTATATADASGNYTIINVVAGTYAVTPSKVGYTFAPASTSVTVGPNATGKHFVPTAGVHDRWKVPAVLPKPELR